MKEYEAVKYELNYDEASKKIQAVVFGYFQPEDLKFFIGKYGSIIKKINPAEYELFFDCEYLRITMQDLVGMLTSCFEIFETDHFKKIIINCGKHPAIISQVTKVADSVKLNNYEITHNE